MQPADRDAALLSDMLKFCREVRDLTPGLDLEKLLADRLLCLAVERCLEIVGEAAGRISPAFRSAHPEIPWQDLKGLRNVLAHDYGDIEYRAIHQTVTRDVPQLLAVLERLLPRD